MTRLAVVVAVVVTAGCTSGGSSSRAEVRDDVAGVAYEIPSGWKEQARDDLVSIFTSAVSSPDSGDQPSAIVGAGVFRSTFYDPAKGGLRGAAVDAVRGFAEFLIPESEHEPVRSDRAMTIGDRDAWRAEYRVQPDDSDDTPSTVTVIAVSAPRPFYLVAVRYRADAALDRTTDLVLSGARFIPATASPPDRD